MKKKTTGNKASKRDSQKKSPKGPRVRKASSVKKDPKKKEKVQAREIPLSNEKSAIRKRKSNFDGEGKKPKDPIGAKKSKVEEFTRKEQRQIKKRKRDDTGILSDLMALYEKLRSKTITVEEKQGVIDKVLSLTAGKENDIIFKHDCVRVLEFCVKFGSKAQREKIYIIYRDNSAELLKSKYAKHLVKKLIKYGTKAQRDFVIKAVYGNVKKLVKQKEASNVLEYIYHQYANSSQRMLLVEEFYGPQYAVFKAAIGRKLEDIFSKEPDQKLEILKHMKDTLIPLANKNSVTFTIIQKPLLEFLTYADGSMRAEMIEALRDRVVHMLHTYEGSRVAMNCIWFGTKKDRKLIVKSFKTFTKKICMEEYGHLALLGAFDVIDDTVSVKKTILSEINADLEEIVKDQYGRKVILYLLSPRDRRFFTPKCISVLEQGDNNQISKKDAVARQAELRLGILDPLFKYLAANIEAIIKDKSMCQILLAAMEHSTDSSSTVDVFNAVVELAAKVIVPDANEEDYVIFHPCAHWVVKRLVQQDKARKEKGKETIFSSLLVKAASKGLIGDWAQRNRGAFVVASLLESGVEEVVSHVKNELNSASSQLNAGQSKGLDIVLKLIGSKL